MPDGARRGGALQSHGLDLLGVRQRDFTGRREGRKDWGLKPSKLNFPSSRLPVKSPISHRRPWRDRRRRHGARARPPFARASSSARPIVCASWPTSRSECVSGQSSSTRTNWPFKLKIGLTNGTPTRRAGSSGEDAPPPSPVRRFASSGVAKSPFRISPTFVLTHAPGKRSTSLVMSVRSKKLSAAYPRRSGGGSSRPRTRSAGCELAMTGRKRCTSHDGAASVSAATPLDSSCPRRRRRDTASSMYGKTRRPDSLSATPFAPRDKRTNPSCSSRRFIDLLTCDGLTRSSRAAAVTDVCR